jgi:Holliday junction resolvasome RuvABC endonuclease subunit
MTVPAGAILALDLGTKTGWAFNEHGRSIISGTWNLAPEKGETEGERYRKFTTALDVFFEREMPSSGMIIAYEDVRRHLGTCAAHVYGGLLATLKTWCLNHALDVPIPVGVKQIKKFWTGNGNSRKKWMVEEALERGFYPADDNEADALALLHLVYIEGPPVAKTKRRKAAAPVTRQARRPVARRAARRLRQGDGIVFEACPGKSGSADKVSEPP